MVKRYRSYAKRRAVAKRGRMARKMKRTAYRATTRRAQISTMRRIAKKEVNKLAEHKEFKVGTSNQPLFSFPSTATIPNNFNSNNILDTSIAYQNIAQGTGEGNRIGNEITLSQLRFSFIINYNAAITQPQFVRMWVVTYKFDPNNAQTADVWSSVQNGVTSSANFFDNGNSSNGMLGTMLDLIAPVNTDVMTVHKCKTYKIGCATAPSGGATAGNNDFKYAVKDYIDLLKYVPKRVKYNDTATTSFNKKVFIIFECLAADGTVVNDTAPARCLINYFYNVKWTDV